MTAELQLTELLIDGKQVPAADGRSFTVLDPSDGTAIAQVALAGKADVDQAVAAARAAFTAPEWARMRAASITTALPVPLSVFPWARSQESR